MGRRCLIWAAVSTKPQADDDKFSISKQVEDARAFAERQKLAIAEVLIVPGHSRSYRTLDKLAEDARQQGIDAFDRLIQHFDRRDFDVFICRDANRFARKASLLHYIAETIVEDVGATIYDMANAVWVDADNVDMWATMQGFKTSAEIKWLKTATREGLIKRAERGLTTTNVPFSHHLIRDERNKPMRVEVDESRRRLFDDLYTLIVQERTAFNGIEVILFERFGHATPGGQPYGDGTMYNFLFHPLTWGFTTYGANRDRKGRNYGTWVFDESEAPPEGVLRRGMIEPVYTGIQAERLKAELLRRKEMMGSRRPKTTRMFSGLFICGECTWALSSKSVPDSKGGRRVYALRCGSGHYKFQNRPLCSQSKISVPITYVQEYVDGLLRRLIRTEDFSELIPDQRNSADALQMIGEEIRQVVAALDNLISIQAAAHPSTQGRYQARIDKMGEQLAALERRQMELVALANRSGVDLSRAEAGMRTIGEIIDDFWTLPEAEINQHLHALMGRWRFVILNGVIIKIAIPPPRRQHK